MIWSKDNFNEHLSQFKAISEKQHPIRSVPYISKSHFLQFNIWGNSSHRSLCFSLLFQFVGGSSESHSDITQSALQPHLEDRSADLRRPPAAPGPLVQSHLSHRRARFLDIPQDLKFILQLNRQGRRWVHISSLYKDNGSQRVGFPESLFIITWTAVDLSVVYDPRRHWAAGVLFALPQASAALWTSPH